MLDSFFDDTHYASRNVGPAPVVPAPSHVPRGARDSLPIVYGPHTVNTVILSFQPTIRTPPACVTREMKCPPALQRT